jgi:glycosyltransferase involved in cell wall biosynthesis
MKTVIIFHIGLFAEVTGSGEKLLRDMALILADSSEFLVCCIYGVSKEPISIPKKIQRHPHIKLIHFVFAKQAARPPWKPEGMLESIEKVIKGLNPSVFICLVSSGDQWPITSLPSTIPMLIISPFGDFCSNGNVRGLYVSGQTNVSRLKGRGLVNAEVFFNPLVDPEVKDRTRIERNRPIVFGRVGRNDSFIFDPISLQAFAKLEHDFGAQVKYIYVNPSIEARELVENLKLQRVEFREWLSAEELQSFFSEIDVFAHARRDGETLGVAIAEAMLNACPVVSHKSSEFNEHLFLLQKPFGFVAEVDDIDGYYDHLKWLVLNQNQIYELGEQARAFALQYFDEKVVAKKVLNDCQKISLFIDKPLCVSIRIFHELLRYNFWIGIIIRKIFKRPLKSVANLFS